MASNSQDYRKYLGILRTHQKLFIVISLAIMTTITVVSYLLPRKYEANAVIFIEKNIISELVKGITATTTLDDSVKVLTYALNSRNLMLKVVNDLDINLKNRSDADIEKMINDFKKNTTIRVKDKDLFTISFRHADPKFARDYVNSLVRSYIAANVTAKRDQTIDASQFLADQIGNFKEKVDKAASAVLDYKGKAGGIANLDESAILQEIHAAQQKLYDLQMQRQIIEGQMRNARTIGDPLSIKLAGLQKRLEELRIDYTDNYPEVQSIRAQIESLKSGARGQESVKTPPIVDPQEMARLGNELAALKATEQQLNRFIATNQSLLSSVPAARANLEKLETEKEGQKKMYDTLFSRHNQSEVTREMQLEDRTATFRIVDPAVTPVRPSSPDRIRIMLMGIIAGFAGAAALLILLDTLNEAVKTTADLDSFHLPVLAIIPFYQTPLAVQQAAAAMKRYYLLSGSYFIFLLSFLLMEFFEITLMDRLLNSIGLPELMKRFFQ
ncbi:MAG: chain-length determining protein [Deltaproteobacteria bacterium HGW-Deltaproteobacteria-23]|nr:MAG: chain-length determining protein [Deltaproteobacteria bacterium HGW-Deltaproteobacteria-23]